MRTSWSRNPHSKTLIPEKPSKSGLIGVWHQDHLYLGTNTIANGKPPPNKYLFVNEKYKDDATKLVVLRLVVFSSLENQGREIISPTHTHTKCGKQEVLLIRILCNLTCLWLYLYWL